MKFLLVLAAAVPLFGQTTCTFAVSANSFVAQGGASDPTNLPRFTVTTQSGCIFLAVNSTTWLHLTAPARGTNFTGTTVISFSLDANPGTELRTDQIAIYPGTEVISGGAVAVVHVAQIASTCIYSIAPTSAGLPVAGGAGSLTVTSGCAWSARASTFLTLTAPQGTLGTAPINYQAGANTCVASRTGQIILTTGTANPPVFTLTQDGSTSNLQLSATNLTIGSGALANQQVTVTTGATCGWASYTDSASWLHVTTGSAGTGAGTYVYSVDANQGGQRTGHVYFQSGLDATGAPILATSLTITQQSVQVAGPQLTAILNGASYALGAVRPGPVSPGEIVALFGTNMGPLTGSANTQTFGTSLAGVQVMFGSTSAPLIYVSAQQINAVVPYAVSGSSNVAVTVQYGGATSPALTVPVQAATPGIFSYDRTGSGPGAILNQDNGLNAAARPAAVGSVVAIYCTGGGVTVPASLDGSLTSLTPPFPGLATQPVTVTIGGVSARVVYAGPAPGALAGLTQIDAIVPAGVKSGPAVPVVVSIGGVSSQDNLSMAVQ